MRRNRPICTCLLVLACAVVSCMADVTRPSPPGTRYDGPGERATVVSVVDGDTIRATVGNEVALVRYIGIDAPETGHSDGTPEWLADEATDANRGLVEGQEIYLEKDVSETDRYGRLLRYIFLEDGTFVNAELVRLGYAEARAYAPDVGRQAYLDEMERQAREARRGLWGPRPTTSSADGG